MASSGRFPVRVPLDMTNNQIYNAIMQVLASAPSSPTIGLYYMDSALDTPRIWSSTRSAWITLDATKLSNAIPLTAIVNIAAATILGNNTGASGAPLALTAAQTKTLLAIVPSDISGFMAQVYTARLDQLAAAGANISMGGFLINNLGPGVAGTDAVNVNQLNAAVQSASAGISAKGSCVAVSTTNVASLSGVATVVDGVTLGTVGMRVLLTGQTTASQNGPWVVQSGSWTRPTTDSNNELETGALWFIEQGTSKGQTQWWLNSPAAGTTITPGTTAIGIVQFGAASAYTAGTNGGLQLVGSAFSVLLPAGSGLVTDSTGLHLDTTVVTRKYATTLTTSATSYTVTHNLGTTDVTVELVNLTTGDIEQSSINIPNTTTVTVAFAVAPAANQYRVIVQG